MFPSIYKSRREKSSKEYIKQYIEAAFNYSGGFDAFNSRRDKFRMLRKWAEGMQDIDHLKQYMSAHGEISYMNINWQPLPILAEISNKIINQLSQIEYDVIADAIDPESKVKKDDFIAKQRANMTLRETVKVLNEQGVNFQLEDDKGFQSEKDLDKYMSLSYKQSSELIAELLTTLILNTNKNEQLKRKIYKDLVTLKFASIKTYYDSNYRVKIKYVDPEYIITPYSDKDDFSDIDYCGEIMFMTLGDVINECDIEANDLANIAELYEGKYGNPTWQYNWSYLHKSSSDFYSLPYIDFKIPVLDLQFKSPTYRKYEGKTNKYGNRRIHEKEVNFKQSEWAKSDSLLYTFELEELYKGKWIIGSDIVFDYGLCENILREKLGKEYDKEAKTNYVIFSPDMIDMENRSIIERGIPHAEQMQLAHLKIQHLLSTATPSGYAYDIAALAEVIIGGQGEKPLSPMQIAELHSQTGKYFYSSVNLDGEKQHNIPITPTSSPIYNDIQAQISIYNFHRSILMDITGWNDAANGTIDKDALVGIQKIQINASSLSVKNLKDSYRYMMELTIENILIMTQYVMKYGGQQVKNYYVNSVGNDTINILKHSDDYTGASFGITIQYIPTEEEKQDYVNALNIALQRDLIKVSTFWKLKQIKNLKLGYVYLKNAEEEYVQEKQSIAKQNSDYNTQSNIQATQSSIEGKKQELLLSNQAKSELLQIEFELDQEAKEKDAIRQKEIISHEFEQRMKLQELVNGGKIDVAKEIHSTGGSINDLYK